MELCRAGALLFVLQLETLVLRPAGKELRVEVDCEPGMCHCSKEINSLLGYMREVMEVIFPSALLRQIWCRILSLDSPFRSKTWVYWSESRNEMWIWLRAWRICNVRRGWERLCGLKKPIMCVNIWWDWVKKIRIRLFSIAQWARGSEHKVKHRKFHLTTTKPVFFQRWSNTCTAYPERLWRFHLWRYSKPIWAQH